MPVEKGRSRQRSLAQTAVEWILFLLLAANLVWSTLCLGAYRPETQLVTYALTLSLVALRLAAPGAGPGTLGRHAGFAPLLVFLAYAAANAAFVSVVPWLGWLDFLGWLQLVGVFWVVRSSFEDVFLRRCLYGLMLVVAFASVGLACYQYFRDPSWLMLGRHQLEQYEGRASGPFGIPNSLAGLLILLLPSAAAATWDRSLGVSVRVCSGYLCAALAFGLVLTMSRGGWLSLLVALAAAPFLFSRASLAKRLGGAAVVVLAGLVFSVVLYGAVPAARKRFDALVADGGERTRPVLWSAAWKIFEERPFFGGGAGSYNVLFERHRPEDCQREPQWAHNEYLNTLSDYGAVGFLLLSAGVGTIVLRSGAFRGSRSRGQADQGRAFPRGMERGFLVGIVAFALQLSFDFHLKIPALSLALATVAGLVFTGKREETGAADRLGPNVWGTWRFLRLTFGVALAVLFVAFFRPLLAAEAIRYEVRERLDGLARSPEAPEREARLLVDCESSLLEAARLDPAHGYAWSDLSYVKSLKARLAPLEQAGLGMEAEAAARTALKASAEVSEFWIRLGVSLDLQGRWLEAGEAFTVAHRLAPSSANVLFYLAFHYSLRKSTTEQARSLVAICLRLDPSHGPAQLLQSRLANEPSHR